MYIICKDCEYLSIEKGPWAKDKLYEKIIFFKLAL